MPFDAEAPRQSPPTMADCPIFRVRRDAEYAQMRAKALAEAADEDPVLWLADQEEAERQYQDLARRGVADLRGDRTPLTVWSGR